MGSHAFAVSIACSLGLLRTAALAILLDLGFPLGLLLLLLSIVEDVEKVVDGAVPLLACLVDGVLELHGGLLFADVEEKGCLDEADRGLI